MKTAFLFPGQGAQVVGMGKDIAEHCPAAADLFEKANEIVGYDLRHLCFEGPEEALNTTTVSQPAIFTVTAALLELLRQTHPELWPDVTAGLSMGEYSALYAAGLMSFEDALKLVQERGRAMQAAADASNGSMVSILGLDEEKVRALCRQAAQGDILEPVNFNCPGQIVISGSSQVCIRAEALAEKYGAMKAVPLAVAAPLIHRRRNRLRTGSSEPWLSVRFSRHQRRKSSLISMPSITPMPRVFERVWFGNWFNRFFGKSAWSDFWPMGSKRFTKSDRDAF